MRFCTQELLATTATVNLTENRRVAGKEPPRCPEKRIHEAKIVKGSVYILLSRTYREYHSSIIEYINSSYITKEILLSRTGGLFPLCASQGNLSSNP